jgi:hypothetical protein
MTFFQPSSSSEIRATRRRMEFLLSSFNPTLIAVARSEVAASHNASSVRTLIRSIRTEARARSIPFQSVNRRYIRDSFLEHDAKSKDEIASALVDRFPELRWKLPRKRQTWQKEHFRMTLFDAVALGVACCSRLSETEFGNPNNRYMSPPAGLSVTYRRMIRPPRLEGAGQRASIYLCPAELHGATPNRLILNDCSLQKSQPRTEFPPSIGSNFPKWGAPHLYLRVAETQ